MWQQMFKDGISLKGAAGVDGKTCHILVFVGYASLFLQELTLRQKKKKKTMRIRT